MNDIRLIIAGSRDFNNSELLDREVDRYLEEILKEGCEIEIISGGARGADRLGEAYAKIRDYKVKKFIPDWEKYKKSAGYIRNEEMAKYATHCIIFNLDRSKGSVHMENIAIKYKLGLKVVNISSESKPSKLDKLIELTEEADLYDYY
jgi:hypothetical protein